MDNPARTALRAMLSEHSALEVMRILLGELDLHPGELAQARSMADLALHPHYKSHRKRVEDFLAANVKWYALSPAMGTYKSHAVSSLYSQHGPPTSEGLTYQLGPLCGITYNFHIEVPWDFHDSDLNAMRDRAVFESTWCRFSATSPAPQCSVCARYLKNSQQGDSSAN